MKFSEKLANLRKKNNFSQEQLAEKLSVSRQAVSKWESQVSYPDMAKMIQLCEILNCKLPDLLDDGVMGEEVEDKSNKIDLYEYFKGFLNLVTQIYNMFVTMTLKGKLKCFFEMSFVGLTLIVIFMILHVALEFLFRSIVYTLASPNIYYTYVSNIFNMFYYIFAFVLFITIFFHIFKIRYLDYYVTIFDKAIDERVVEKDVTVKDDSTIREKIIIRDPSHSKNMFFEFLGKILVLMFKGFVLAFALPIIIFFILSLIAVVLSFVHIKYNMIFLYGTLAFVGVALGLYCFIEFIYKFTFNLSQTFKKLFIIFISGLLIFSIGAGLSVNKLLSMDQVSYINNPKMIKEEFEMETIENIDYWTFSHLNYSLIEEDRDDYKIEVEYPEEYVFEYVEEIGLFSYYQKIENKNLYPRFLEAIKKDQLITSYNKDYDVKFKVYANKENLDLFEKKLTEN